MAAFAKSWRRETKAAMRPTGMETGAWSDQLFSAASINSMLR
jgi:hypothetical protein